MSKGEKIDVVEQYRKALKAELIAKQARLVAEAALVNSKIKWLCKEAS